LVEVLLGVSARLISLVVVPLLQLVESVEAELGKSSLRVVLGVRRDLERVLLPLGESDCLSCGHLLSTLHRLELLR